MNRDEAFKILNFNENTNPTPAEIMKRFEKMYIDNNPKAGGSFYLQTKIYFAKEFLMSGYKEFNKSKFNPGENTEKTQEAEKSNENINDKI